MLIPSNLFECEEVKYLEDCKEGDSFLSLWLQIFMKARPYHGNIKVYEWPYTKLTFHDIAVFFDSRDEVVEMAFVEFEKLGIAKLLPHQIFVKVFWEDEKPRNESAEYRVWRGKVMMRDGFRCKVCGEKEDLQAHHIVSWKDTEGEDPLRFDVNNGITLCRSCHLIAHGGSWKKSSTVEMMENLRNLIREG